MARWERAEWNPSGTTPGGFIVPRLVIFHVTAGLGDAKPHSGLEWHFEVSLDGDIQQQVDTSQRADANYLANPFAISVETEGLGDGIWTDPQLRALVELSEWILSTHPDVKRQTAPTWDGAGFGYHVMFGAPGMWTNVAKSCPGLRRIQQFKQELMPRILQGEPSPWENEMKAHLATATEAAHPKPVYLVGPYFAWAWHVPNEDVLAGLRWLNAGGNNGVATGFIASADQIFEYGQEFLDSLPHPAEPVGLELPGSLAVAGELKLA